MARETGISWARSTFNPWIGCQKVGPGCDHCYAEELDSRRVFGGELHFGPHAPRLRTKQGNWNEVRRWNRKAIESSFAGIDGFWPVFSGSLCDVFDNQVDPAWRADLWALIKECSNLTFMLLTKRIGNVLDMLPADWGKGYPNVWIGATVVNQAEADRDLAKLMAVPVAKRFLSMEPLLGSVNLRLDQYPVDWVIVGGESGANARPMHPEWVLSIQDQCRSHDVPFFFKQWGEWLPRSGHYHRFADGSDCADLDPDSTKWLTIKLTEDGGNAWDLAQSGDRSVYMQRVGIDMAGCLLNGTEEKRWPVTKDQMEG